MIVRTAHVPAPRFKLVTKKLSSKTTQQRRFFATETQGTKPRVAVVLSGCGFQDGSEIQESVSILLHLNQKGAFTKCFAPVIPSQDVINHVTGKPMPGALSSRPIMEESARITRGNIMSLMRLRVEDFDAIIFPGGYGAAKNLSTWAKDKEKFRVWGEVERVVKEFHANKKPIGMCCIAPVIAAKVVPGAHVTLGTLKEPIEIIAKLKNGSVAIPKGVTDILVDEKNKIVTTPAYMEEAEIAEVHEGIGKMVQRVLDIVSGSAPASETPTPAPETPAPETTAAPPS